MTGEEEHTHCRVAAAAALAPLFCFQCAPGGEMVSRSIRGKIRAAFPARNIRNNYEKRLARDVMAVMISCLLIAANSVR